MLFKLLMAIEKYLPHSVKTWLLKFVVKQQMKQAFPLKDVKLYNEKPIPEEALNNLFEDPEFLKSFNEIQKQLDNNLK